MSRLDDIKKRLGRVEQPWFARFCEDARGQPMTVVTKQRPPCSPGIDVYSEDGDDTVAVLYHESYPRVTPDENDENAEFIAAAPDDMRWLIEQLETRL